MSWAYNEIDIYLTDTDSSPGETSIGNSWKAVSEYGIVRSRVALTPSTYDSANKITIAGRDGRPYTTDRSRGNAKIDIEVLCVDSWVFAGVNTTVRQRAESLMARINKARRIAYKQPGKSADGYFLIYNTTLSITDADEKAIVIKASFEVHPLEWIFAGNAANIIESGATETITIPEYCAVSMPIYDLMGSGTVNVNGNVLESTSSGSIRLDTWRFTAVYRPSGLNANLSLSGDYEGLWLNPGENTITNGLTNAIRVYTRMGITR